MDKKIDPRLMGVDGESKCKASGERQTVIGLDVRVMVAFGSRDMTVVVA